MLHWNVKHKCQSFITSVSFSDAFPWDLINDAKQKYILFTCKISNRKAISWEVGNSKKLSNKKIPA